MSVHSHNNQCTGERDPPENSKKTWQEIHDRLQNNTKDNLYKMKHRRFSIHSEVQAATLMHLIHMMF
jgi:hypothetical protein